MCLLRSRPTDLLLLRRAGHLPARPPFGAAGPFHVPRYHPRVTSSLPFRPELLAAGATDIQFRAALPIGDLPPGVLRRVTFGDHDVLLAHTDRGIAAVDDRCPHMSAPLSIGGLDGCVVSCPLHGGRFDLASGEPVQMPTTGGLRPDGSYEPTWAQPGREPKEDPPGPKTDARRLTRVRRFRYYPVRVVDGVIEVAVPD